MHILTSDKSTKSQLSLLLRDLGYAPRFYSESSQLLKALEVSQPSASALIDLHFELNDSALKLITLHERNCVEFISVKPSFKVT